MHVNRISHFGPEEEWVKGAVLYAYDHRPSDYFTPEKIYRLIFIKEFLGLLISIMIIFGIVIWL